MLSIRIEKTDTPKQLPAADNPLKFGTIFTDHITMSAEDGPHKDKQEVIPMSENFNAEEGNDTITITLEDDTELVCDVITIFPCQDKNYILNTR